MSNNTDTRKKILIDTDIGDDIDDAYALLSAISLDFDIVGITTVFRNTEERAKMTKKLLSLFGEKYANIPVYAGFGTPIAEAPADYPHLCQYTKDLENPQYTPESVNPDDAVKFISDCCEKYGKELTIAAIGPFTNIAKTIEKYPQALKKAHRVVIMGGAYFRQYADWNVMCDVEAADIMFQNTPNLHCIGADVTHKLIPEEALVQVVEKSDNKSPAYSYLRSLYHLWKQACQNPPFILHDALVMHYIADESICTMEKACVKVLTQGAPRGVTFNIDAYKKAYMNPYFNDIDTSSKICVASDVQVEEFISRVIQDISKYN